MFDIDAALMRVIETEGSDLHLKVPSRPVIRRHGQLAPIPDSVGLRPGDTERVLFHMLTDDVKLEAFRVEREVDFSYSIPGVARFRVNAFVQRGSVSLVCRAIPYNIKSVNELLLPPVISDIADEERGLVLLTGTTGSGKSTTLAAMIDHINHHYTKHVVTIEDPVEFLHRDKNSIINQREVGEDTVSFARALRRVLRQDPDVILIGEMRDDETVRAALSAAETGHLVLSTIHTVDASESVNRIIDFFPLVEQRQARAMLAGTLKAVVSQRLVPTPDRNARVACCEILRMTGRVRDMILDSDMTGKLPEVIAEGAFYGMQTFDQALLYHVQAGRVAMDDALKAASHPHDFKLLVSSDGQRSTSVDSMFSDSNGGEPAAGPPPLLRPTPVAPAQPAPPAEAPAPVASATPPAPVAPAAPVSSPVQAAPAPTQPALVSPAPAAPAAAPSPQSPGNPQAPVNPPY